MKKPQERTVELGGVMYKYYDIGLGSLAVVILHGVAWSKEWSLETMAHLHKNYRCLALDLPGHNGICLDGYSTLQDMARYVKGFIRHMALSKVVVLGFSLGGMVAYSLENISRGESWLKGVIVWSSPLLGSGGLTKQARVIASGAYFPPRVQSIVKRSPLITGATKALHFRVTDAWMTAFSKFSPEGGKTFVGMILQSDFKMNPEIPSLFVYDPDDTLVSKRNIDYLMSRVTSNLVLEVIPGSGHGGTDEGQCRAYIEMARFLKGLENT